MIPFHHKSICSGWPGKIRTCRKRWFKARWHYQFVYRSVNIGANDRTWSCIFNLTRVAFSIKLHWHNVWWEAIESNYPGIHPTYIMPTVLQTAVGKTSLIFLVAVEGFPPSRPYEHQFLKLACIVISSYRYIFIINLKILYQKNIFPWIQSVVFWLLYILY